MKWLKGITNPSPNPTNPLELRDSTFCIGKWHIGWLLAVGTFSLIISIYQEVFEVYPAKSVATNLLPNPGFVIDVVHFVFVCLITFLDNCTTSFASCAYQFSFQHILIALQVIIIMCGNYFFQTLFLLFLLPKFYNR